MKGRVPVNDLDHPHQDLIKDLHGLGFNDYEAKAYIALLRLQPATAYEVSREAGLPKANGYTVLEGLTKKEAVQPISETPVRYMAVAPEILFDRIVDTTERRCARLKEGLAKLSISPQQEFVWSISGTEVINAKLEEMIEASREHLWIKASEDALERHREALQRAADRNVAICIILYGTRLADFQFGGRTRTWLHEGNGILVGLAQYLVTFTRDYEEALVAELRADARGSYTRNAAIVNMADTLIRHEIYLAEIFEKFGDGIQAAFGPGLLFLRQDYLPVEQVNDFKNRLKGHPIADQVFKTQTTGHGNIRKSSRQKSSGS